MLQESKNKITKQLKQMKERKNEQGKSQKGLQFNLSQYLTQCSVFPKLLVVETNQANLFIYSLSMYVIRFCYLLSIIGSQCICEIMQWNVVIIQVQIYMQEFYIQRRTLHQFLNIFFILLIQLYYVAQQKNLQYKFINPFYIKLYLFYSTSLFFSFIMKGLQEETLAKYTYNKDKPVFSASNYNVFHGTSKQSNLPVTIKTLKYPHVQLGPYLKKMKDCKSQNVIKIYQLVVEQQFLIFVAQQTTFGNMKKGLQPCKYLDQSDAIFISKQMLSGHVDLLRFEINWFGTQEDIQFTQDGQLKLSWNNGCSFNLVNPFPVLINRISNRLSDPGSNTMLPFPQSKLMQQLIRISKQNASQIAMNPQMKKKDKNIKKKGKNWIGIKQYKNKNEYFDEFNYFSVHQQFGFVKVKIFDQGKISPNLLQLNKTKSSFTKIHDVYDQGNKTIIISEYSNDGNLQSYVTRLKTAGIKLKEDQIQFFVYSLLEPLKQVQQSSLKAICMLNIKNIYIQSGIPKIGEPIPLNQKINQVLIDRSDVPDFYHTDFKKQPTLRQPKFDTYSLGVLLYKLMYTQLPIFPNGKVHIPTAPAYNKRLKQSVEIFLNQGGTISQIQQRIQVSEQVRKQIQQNKQKFKKDKGGKPQQNIQKVQKGQQSEQDHHQELKQSQTDSHQHQHHQQQESDDESGPGCIEKFKKKIQLKHPKKVEDQKRFLFVDQLELSTFKNFRLWSKVVVIFVLYTFLFYYTYIQNSVILLASQGLLTKIDLTIGGKNVSVISTDKYQFEKVFNSTEKSLAQLQGMNCLIQDSLIAKPYTDFIKQDSDLWLGYIFVGLGSLLVILLFKAIQIHTFDEINAWFRKQQGHGHFNISNWFLLNWHWLTIISGHFFVFQYVFQPMTQPCVGYKKGNIWGSTKSFFEDHDSFMAPYIVVFALQLFFYLCYLIMIGKNIEMTPKYNKILNTITIYGAILIVFWLMFRFGVILKSFYYPAAISDSQSIIPNEWKTNNYILFFAILPEFLFVIELVCISIINWIYYIFVDKSQRLLSNQASMDASLNAIV